jgi:ribosome biogenesis GTPase
LRASRPLDYPSRIVTTRQNPERTIVAQVFGTTALVWDGRATREATLSQRLRTGLDPTRSNALAVGDEVALEDAGGALPSIVGIAPRRTQLERVATGSQGRIRMQVIAANADQTMIVASLADPPFRPGLVDRWTLLALRGGMDAVLCMNKVDLGSGEEAARLVADGNIPLDTDYVSAATGHGLDALRERLAGRATVLVGHSGVGKSSLLRRLLPDCDAATGEVSARTRKGRHTTASSRLYPIPEGGLLIDTPGVRSVVLGPTQPGEVAGVFSEIAHAPPCRFRPCTHRTEPGCTVLRGLEDGTVPREVYGRYRKLLEEAGLP